VVIFSPAIFHPVVWEFRKPAQISAKHNDRITFLMIIDY